MPDSEKIVAGIEIGLNLIMAGTEIVNLLKDKDDITKEELLAIIKRENQEQAKAFSKIEEILQQ